MGAFLALIDRITAAAAWVAAACLGLLAVIVLAEVAAVTLFNRSLDFTWEIGAFLMAAAFFLGLGWTLNSQGHVRVQLFQQWLSPRARHLLEAAATAVALAVALFLTMALATLAIGSAIDGSRTFTITATPLAIPQGVVALGAGLLALQLLARLIRLGLGLAADTAKPPDEESP